MVKEFVYFKKNVSYVVGGRFFIGDPQGWSVTDLNPYVAVDKDRLRDFKVANKRAIVNGLIIPADEPALDWETNNAVTDEMAVDLVKGNYLTLKKALEKIDSIVIVGKLLEAAKENDRPKKTLAVIQSRLEELKEDDDFITPADMRGVSNA